MTSMSNVIPFPRQPRGALTDLEMVRGALNMVVFRLNEVENLDSDTERFVLSSLRVVLAWLESRETG